MVTNPRCDVWKYFDNVIEEGVAVCKLCKNRLQNKRSYSLRKHMTQLHNPRTNLWKYFLHYAEDGIVECKICQKHLRNNRMFNLSKHLKHHGITVDQNFNPAKSSGKPVVKENLCILMDEQNLINAVVGLLIDEGVAPKIFSSKNMGALLNPVCEAISEDNNKLFTINGLQSERAINSVASFIRKEFINDLGSRLLTLRIDSDASVSSYVFSVSVQFVNEEQLQNHFLGEIHLEDEQTLCSEYIMNILREYNIDAQQIVCAYFDDDSKVNRSVSNLVYLDQIREFEKNPDIIISNVKLQRYVGVIAQLCMLDILKTPIIYELFVECRNLTKFINAKQAVFTEAFKENSLNIPQIDSPWKWGSTYDMMNDLKNAFCVLDSIEYQPPESVEDRFNFNKILKSFIEAFCKALRFLQNCLKKFWNSEMIYGDFYGQWLKCKLLTEKLYAACSKEDTILALICSELVKSIEKRSNELLNLEHFKACLYLDPRFQGTLNMREKMFAVEYLERMWRRAKLYNKELVDPVTKHPPPAMESLEMDSDDNGDEILNEFLFKSVQETCSKGIYKQLEQLKLPFQTVETDVMLYWKQLRFGGSEIYTLAAICLAIPATNNCNKNKRLTVNSNDESPLFRKNMNIIRCNQQLLPKAVEKLDLFVEDNASQDYLVTEDNTSKIEISEKQIISQDSSPAHISNSANPEPGSSTTENFNQ